MNIIEKFLEKGRELGLSDEELRDYVGRIGDDRTARYKKNLIDKWGIPLLQKVRKFMATVSKKEKEGMGIEDQINYFAQHAKAGQISEGEWKKILGKDGKGKVSVKHDLLKEIPDPEWSEKEANFVPKKKEVKKEEEDFKFPTQKEMKRMSSEEIRKIGIAAQDAMKD